MSEPAPAAPSDPLQGLRPQHPRLVLTHDAVEGLRRRIAAEPEVRDLAAQLRARAEKLLAADVSTYDIEDGRRLLPISRRVVERMHLLGLFALLDDDRRFADRAWRELEAAAAFPDWNPDHFLDTAEMTSAFGLGFDWLHPFLDETQQQVIADAIVKLGFTPAIPYYDRGGFWPQADNNWNVVCNGGLGIAALAIAERVPDLARRVLREAVSGMPFCLRHFAPDGGWAEGAGYWVYTHDYLCYFLASCHTALGHDFGLGDTPGLERSALFVVRLNSPAGGSFNFSDSRDAGVYTPALLYHAQRYDVPPAAEHQLRTRYPRAFDLIWRPDTDPRGAIAALPLDYRCRGVECITLRSAWNDPAASFFGIQCGENRVGHNRLDKGSFVYESRGVRWFFSLSADDYNQPEFFGKLRYDYYRNRAEGHNTLVVNPGPGMDQDRGAGGRITAFDSRDDGASAALDLSPSYPWAGRVERRIDYRRTGGVTLTDEVEGRDGAPVDVWWFAHTRTQVELDDTGRQATLRDAERGEELVVQLLEPADARFTVMPAQPLPTSPNPATQNPNDGTYREHAHRVMGGPPPLLDQPDPKLATRKLAVHVPNQSGVRITVRWDG